jgi:hypothetical protein
MINNLWKGEQMVRTSYQFHCDICDERYSSATMAASCESKGQPTIIFPRGLIFQLTEDDEARVYAVKCDTIIGHHHSLECWEVDVKNMSDMEGIEARVKAFEFQTIQICPPKMEMLAEAMARYMIAVKALVAKKLIEMEWWKSATTAVG